MASLPMGRRKRSTSRSVTGGAQPTTASITPAAQRKQQCLSSLRRWQAAQRCMHGILRLRGEKDCSAATACTGLSCIGFGKRLRRLHVRGQLRNASYRYRRVQGLRVGRDPTAHVTRHAIVVHASIVARSRMCSQSANST
eukprot:5777788-Prymnesium_polylepis.1